MLLLSGAWNRTWHASQLPDKLWLRRNPRQVQLQAKQVQILTEEGFIESLEVTVIEVI